MVFDPRTSIRYARMLRVIDLIEKRGPQSLDEICRRTKLTRREFVDARSSLHGRLALEDSDYSMPRPVAGEDYVYKLAATFRTGPFDTDGDINIQAAIADTVTRLATTYLDVSQLISLTSGRSKIRRLLQEMGKALETTIINADRAAMTAGAPISAKAEYALNMIFPPGPPPLTATP